MPDYCFGKYSHLIVQLLISSFIACEANVLISLIILQISFKSCYFAWDSINSGASFCILWKVFSLLFTKVALSYILIRSVLYIFVSWNFLLLFTLFFWYIFVYIFQMPSHPVVLGSTDRTHFKKSLIGCFWAHFLIPKSSKLPWSWKIVSSSWIGKCGAISARIYIYFLKDTGSNYQKYHYNCLMAQPLVLLYQFFFSHSLQAIYAYSLCT